MKRREPDRSQVTAEPTRLQKFLADAGVASRRRAEEFILEGRVIVNGRVVDELPAFVDPARDRVLVDGDPVRPRQLEYWVLHKPKGVTCGTHDSAGRRRATDFLPDGLPRLQAVGWLDPESSGLLLLTNDHEFAQAIAGAKRAAPVVYRAEVRGQVTPDFPLLLKRGVHLAEGKASVLRSEILHRARDSSALDIQLLETRNRQLRRILARLGHKAVSLKRIEIGPLRLKGLPVGACRRLQEWETAGLERAAVEVQERTRAIDGKPARPRTTRPPPRSAAAPAAAAGERSTRTRRVVR